MGPHTEKRSRRRRLTSCFQVTTADPQGRREPERPTDSPLIVRSARPRRQPSWHPAPTVRKKPGILNLAIIALVVPGLFCTVALPAYAYSPAATDEGGEATAALSELKADGAQSVAISEEVALAAPARDNFTATTAAELRRAQLRVQYAAYSGPSVGDYLEQPAVPELQPRPGRRGRAAVPGRAVPLRRREPVRLRLLRLHHVRLRPVRRRAAALRRRVRVRAARRSRRPTRVPATSSSWTAAVTSASTSVAA